ncbi:MAG: 5-methyltetrahydrofolate--homocysteine methyltransferase, partial [Bacteroidaceae bacterium]|nr:5-methyltetrahydrofolate--homocysteine methyltransferase [Bacteroidaceae bacterium]
MEQLLVNYKVHEVIEYINWLYFFHAWGFAPRYATIAHVHDCAGCRASWLASFTTDEQLKAREAIKLITDARNMLEELEGQLTCKCTFQLFDAQAQGDNLMIGSTLFPLLRQQNANNKENICLCISDFIKPIELNIQDKIGVFAATVNDTTIVSSEDDYHNLLVQTLCDRLVEAAVEKLHLYVRKEAWGYAPDEHLSIPELLQEKFQGIRPAVGYPSLP